MTDVAILVCTYRRPQLFGAFMRSVNELVLPEGVRLHVAIADNNPDSEREGYVAQPLAQCRFPCLYGHEAQRGYASARNKSVELGLATPATVFLTSDDDQLLPQDWIKAHLDCLDAYGADVVCGGAVGDKRQWTEGQVVERVSTRNTSFRRKLVDPAGWGMRFNTGFDQTGYEDHDFFARAAARGAKLVFSYKPVIINNDPDEAPGSGFSAARELNKAHVARAGQRNTAVALRRQGKYARLAGFTLGAAWLFVKGVLGVIAAVPMRLFGPAAGRAKLIDGVKHLLKAWGRIEGLYKDEIARQDVRRNG